MALIFRDSPAPIVPDAVVKAAAAVGAIVQNDRAWFTATLLHHDRFITAAHEMRTAGDANESVMVFNMEQGERPADRVIVRTEPERFTSVYEGKAVEPFPDYAICGLTRGIAGVSPAVPRMDLPAVGEDIYVVSHMDKFSSGGEGFKTIVVGKVVALINANVISHSAYTLAGDSGSAVFDAQGRLVGIHVQDALDGGRHLAIAVGAIPSINDDLTGSHVVNPVYTVKQLAAAAALFQTADSLHPLLKKPPYPFPLPYAKVQNLIQTLGHTPDSWLSLPYSAQLAHVMSMSEQIGQSWNVATLKFAGMDGTNVYQYSQPPKGSQFLPIPDIRHQLPPDYQKKVGYPNGLPQLKSINGDSLITQADYKRAFCAIRVREGDPNAFGTGIKIGPNAILTARHVIPCAEMLSKINFDFLTETLSPFGMITQYGIKSYQAIADDTAYFASEDGLASSEPWNYFTEFAIIKLKAAPDNLALELSKKVPDKGQKGFVLAIKRESDNEPFADRTIGAELGNVFENTDANEAGEPSDTGAIYMKFNATKGDSGGLVVDSNGNAYGIFTHDHHSNPKPLEAGYSWGTAFWRIAEEVKNRNPGLLEDCPSLARLL